jgi:hypothetical protein
MPDDQKQARMFGPETLPLFSGTAPRGPGSRFEPEAQPRQVSFARCRFCHDTGVTADGFCTCDMGQRARAEAPEASPSAEDHGPLFEGGK